MVGSDLHFGRETSSKHKALVAVDVRDATVRKRCVDGDGNEF